MKKITIAIDGYSSTGKSTIAKELANKLGYVYVDTGAMYRMVSLFAMQNGFITSDQFDEKQLISHLETIDLGFVFNAEVGFAEAYLNEENVEREIRTLDVSNYVSKVAAVSEVRQKLVKIQKKIGQDKGVVMDGRDIGTVVFPDAELKLFMTASANTRAQRRFDELIAKGEQVSFEAILENVVNRDHEDTTREDSPLVKAEDAIEVDNSNLTKEEQFQLIYDLAIKAIEL
ncbi:(d)CMP kinase [Flavicella sediminum]|uniref:(d)CMP kinase n=1 Tax=Flavicella sediminum TaxID=2585141 RepID=UPI0011222386|nr:(d)CMP kinase [Flavicella sediminum]